MTEPSDKRIPLALREARACRLCAADLPHEPRPLVQGSASSRVLLIGQAPGRRAHESGVPWDDASGRRLREWLGVSPGQFYDPALFALLPMGLCYPGSTSAGDLPPLPICAPTWHARIRRALRSVRLTIIIGRHAIAHEQPAFSGVEDAVSGYRALLPTHIALPHPSPRNNNWLREHPEFERDVLPALRHRVREVLGA